jgi:hypothetical protein
MKYDSLHKVLFIAKVEPERQILANKVLSLHVSICMSQMF